MQYRERLCVVASHILLLKLRKSLIILIAIFSPRLPTPVIVYTIYFLLKPLNTVLTVLENTSCLMLNFRCIKTVLLIDACLSLDDNTLCVLYYFLMFYSYSFRPIFVYLSFSFHLKKRVVKAFVWTVVLYRSETWTLQK